MYHPYTSSILTAHEHENNGTKIVFSFHHFDTINHQLFLHPLDLTTCTKLWINFSCRYEGKFRKRQSQLRPHFMTINPNTQVSRTYQMRLSLRHSISSSDEVQRVEQHKAITQLMHQVSCSNIRIVHLRGGEDGDFHSFYFFMCDQKLVESRTQIFTSMFQVLTAILMTIRRRYGPSAHQIKVCFIISIIKGYYSLVIDTKYDLGNKLNGQRVKYTWRRKLETSWRFMAA